MAVIPPARGIAPVLGAVGMGLVVVGILAYFSHEMTRYTPLYGAFFVLVVSDIGGNKVK